MPRDDRYGLTTRGCIAMTTNERTHIHRRTPQTGWRSVANERVQRTLIMCDRSAAGRERVVAGIDVHKVNDTLAITPGTILAPQAPDRDREVPTARAHHVVVEPRTADPTFLVTAASAAGPTQRGDSTLSAVQQMEWCNVFLTHSASVVEVALAPVLEFDESGHRGLLLCGSLASTTNSCGESSTLAGQCLVIGY